MERITEKKKLSLSDFKPLIVTILVIVLFATGILASISDTFVYDVAGSAIEEEETPAAYMRDISVNGYTDSFSVKQDDQFTLSIVYDIPASETSTEVTADIRFSGFTTVTPGTAVSILDGKRSTAELIDHLWGEYTLESTIAASGKTTLVYEIPFTFSETSHPEDFSITVTGTIDGATFEDSITIAYIEQE